MQPVYKNNDFITSGSKPLSEDIFARGICLPSDNKMTAGQQDMIIGIIKGLF
jgi:dTDP-4-amino-4,6-dideoxygalactose transaminase